LNSQINIISFTKDLSPHFYQLNVAWLQRYFYVEPIDLEMLQHPQQYFIEKGGYIFFATYNGEIAGTFALIKHSDTIFELSKMAVHTSFQGKRIGHYMLEYAIATSKALGIKQLILFSNTILEPAIHLYKKYGFLEVPIGNTVYKRSNIKMELCL